MSSRGSRLSSDVSAVEVQTSNQPNAHYRDFEFLQSSHHAGTSGNLHDDTHTLESTLKIKRKDKVKYTRPPLRLDVNFESTPGIEIKKELADGFEYAGVNGVASLFSGYNYNPRGIRNVEDVVHNTIVSKVQAKRRSMSRIFSDLDALQIASPASITSAAPCSLP